MVDNAQIEIMMERYGNMVFRLALTLSKHTDIAEDMFQEVFLRYMKKKPIFANDDHAKAWFLIVCKNCCRSHFKSAFVRYTMPLIENIPTKENKEYGLYYEVLKLPLKYRTIIHLYYFEDYSTKMIASLLHKKDSTIRTQLKRARAMLKVQLDGSDGYEELQRNRE